MMRFGNVKQRRRVAIAMASCLVAATVVAACGGDDDSGAPSTSLPQGSDPVDLDPAEFTTEIDNPYWPMAPGSRWVYRETDTEGTVQRVVVTVTDQTRAIANGIEARVVHDVVTEDGEPVEVTDDWYAQDSTGNIWYLGEDTTEYENGRPTTTAGSFEAGVDGAQPGIILPADPEPGQTYRQEYYAGEAEDLAKVTAEDASESVPFGDFDDLLVIQEWNPLEPEVTEDKYFAPGVGTVLEVKTAGGEGRIELVEFTPAPAQG